MPSVVLNTPLARKPSSCLLELGSCTSVVEKSDSWSDRGSIQFRSLVGTCACHGSAFDDGGNWCRLDIPWKQVDQMSRHATSSVQRERGIDCSLKGLVSNFPANECDRTDESVLLDNTKISLPACQLETICVLVKWVWKNLNLLVKRLNIPWQLLHGVHYLASHSLHL